ncbi:MAG TPA: glycosyltransferase [Anaerolineales bacterium]|nr:glycosyltransferase [Anaerolineales bacterium]
MNGGKFQDTTRVIGFAGELHEIKRLRPLLNAYAQANKVRPSTLLIVGDVRAGEDTQMVEEFKRSYPDIQMIVTGFVSPNDLPVYYSLMDVFVQPALRDGLPNTLLKAMACGKAVIGTPVSGIVEAVTDCKNGRLVSTNNAENWQAQSMNY